MTAAHTLLGLCSRAVVMVWLGAALLVAASDTGLEEPAAELAARVRPFLEELAPTSPPLAEEPPAEASEAETRIPPDASAAPEPVETPVPARVAVQPSDLFAGDALLDGGGAFPPLSSSYGEFGSFTAYASAMRALGARFVVVQRRRIVGGIDPTTGRVAREGAEAGFSPRARNYSDEPGLAAAARAARAHFGPGAEVMMLVPRALDAALFGAIARSLSARGASPGDLREIRARYRRGHGGRIELWVDDGRRFDGSALPLDLVFDLAEVSRLRAEGA